MEAHKEQNNQNKVIDGLIRKAKLLKIFAEEVIEEAEKCRSYEGSFLTTLILLKML